MSGGLPVSAQLRDGARITIRPIEPDDRDDLAAGFERLSDESRYRRFFGPMKELSERDLDRLTRIDHRDHEALVAVDEATGDGVGVARYVRTEPEVAEPAVVVADDWQRRGVGSRLLEALSARAVEEGVVCFRAPVLAQNHDSIALLHHMGETSTTQMGREVEVRIRLLPEPDEGRRELRTLLREVAAGALEPGRTLLQHLLPRRHERPDRSGGASRR